VRYLILFPAVYFAAALDTAFVPAMAIGRIVPDLLALVAVACLCTIPGPKAFVLAAAIGLISDMISPGRLGIGMGCYALVGYALVHLRPKLGLRHPLTRTAASAVAIALLALGVSTLRALTGDATLPWFTLACTSIGVGAYSAFIGLPMFMILGWQRAQ
jgi:rod shape-determining protein MreD